MLGVATPCPVSAIIYRCHKMYYSIRIRAFSCSVIWATRNSTHPKYFSSSLNKPIPCQRDM